MTPPPPLELFRKFIRFGRGKFPLQKDVIQHSDATPL